MQPIANKSFAERVACVLKKSGLLVLDAHKSSFDIVRTIGYFRRQFTTAAILVPLAGYLLYLPLVSNVVVWLGKVFRISLFPVFRVEEEHPINWSMALFCSFYPKTLTKEDKKRKNIEYLQKAKEYLKTKNSIVVLAPYGGPVWFGRKLKQGMLSFIENSRVICLSYSTVLPPYRQKFSSLVSTYRIQNIQEFLKKEYQLLFMQ